MNLSRIIRFIDVAVLFPLFLPCPSIIQREDHECHDVLNRFSI